MPSGGATKPGDVLTAMNKKTVEVYLHNKLYFLIFRFTNIWYNKDWQYWCWGKISIRRCPSLCPLFQPPHHCWCCYSYWVIILFISSFSLFVLVFISLQSHWYCIGIISSRSLHPKRCPLEWTQRGFQKNKREGKYIENDLYVNVFIITYQFWRMPLYKEYKKQLESRVADLMNSSPKR